MEAFQKLDAERRLGLLRWGDFLASGRGSFEHGEDLLHEVVSRVADGRRHWPLRVRLATFLARAMSSVAANDRKSLQGQAVAVDIDDWAAGEDGEEARDRCRSPSAEAVVLAEERREMGRQAIGFVRGKLEGDAAALLLLDCLAEGDEPSEIRERMGLGERELHAARQRVMERFKAWSGRSWP